jgi:predicted ester cyclase
MSVEGNKALVSLFYQAFDEGRLDEFSEYVASTFVANVLGTTTLDWAGFEKFSDLFKSAFPDGRHVFDHMVADDENVVTIGSYQGTHTEPFNGIAATNMALKLPVMHLDRVVGGKIVEHRGLANEHDFMQQLDVKVTGR